MNLKQITQRLEQLEERVKRLESQSKSKTSAGQRTSEPSDQCTLTAPECKQVVELLYDWKDGKFTSWESDFLDTCSAWEGDLTPRQAASVERMYNKYADYLESVGFTPSSAK